MSHGNSEEKKHIRFRKNGFFWLITIFGKAIYGFCCSMIAGPYIFYANKSGRSVGKESVYRENVSIDDEEQKSYVFIDFPSTNIR